jgi:hypothetical protein
MEIGTLLVTGIRTIAGIVFPPLKKKYFDQPKVHIRLTGSGAGFRPEFANEDYYQHPENMFNRLQIVYATWKRNLIFLNHSEHAAYNLKILTELNREHFLIEAPIDSYKPLLQNSEASYSLKIIDTFTRREREAHGNYPAPDYVTNLKLLLEYTNVKGTKFYTSFDNSLDESQKNKFLKKNSATNYDNK